MKTFQLEDLSKQLLAKYMHYLVLEERGKGKW